MQYAWEYMCEGRSRPILTASIAALLLSGIAGAQSTTITLQDALARARKYSGQIQAANIAAQLAHEDTKQARAAALPTVNGFNQFIYTEGNGTASGVFVANDGVHVYNEQLQAHEELLAFVRRGEIRLASATEAVARAKADVAARGLVITVVSDYYAIIADRRKEANARLSLNQANQFVDITRKQEQHGEVAHADVIKAQLQAQQQERALADARLATQKAKIALAVLIFPTLQTDFNVTDEGDNIALPPSLEEASKEATAGSPDLRAAKLTQTQARLGVAVARYAYLPSLGLDVFYGINANEFAAESAIAQESGRSTLPDYLVTGRQNLGYSAQATLNIPLWNWGATHSKVKQAQMREEQARFELSTTEKQVRADVASAQAELQAAFEQQSSLRSSSQLAAESLHLTLLRYQAGEATALEVVDAQSTANQARSAADDGIVRYRIALATLRSLTGTL